MTRLQFIYIWLELTANLRTGYYEEGLISIMMFRLRLVLYQHIKQQYLQSSPTDKRKTWCDWATVKRLT